MNLSLLQLPQEEAKMKEACESMLSLYPRQSYPLEVLCSHYLKTGKIVLSCSLNQKSQNEFCSIKCFCLLLLFSLSIHVLFLSEGVQNEDAVSCFSRLLSLAPNSGLGHLGLGTKALQEGRYEDAIKDLAQG